MSLSTIRTKLKDLIEAIDSVGTVHDYKRYTKEWSEYKTLFTEDSIVNTWEIVRDSCEAFVHGSNQAYRIRHNFIIRGFYGVEDADASEKTFQDIVEDILHVLRGYPDADSTAEKMFFDPNKPCTAIFSTDFLGSVLCHVVEISLTIQEYTTF